MKRIKKIGLCASFGARYGTMPRKRYQKIVEELRNRHRCPNCNQQKVKRESVGIWACRKCSYKFAGGAYTPVTKIGILASRAAEKQG